MDARLIVLGILKDRPAHGYEIKKWLEQSRVEVWSEVLPGSIYHALQQMEREGLVKVQSTERTGQRSRAIYAMTPAGQAAYQEMLRAGWSEARPGFPRRLYTLLSLSHHLPPAEVRAAVDRQIEVLKTERDEWMAGAATKLESSTRGKHLLEAMFANGRAHLEADIAMLERIRGKKAVKGTGK